MISEISFSQKIKEELCRSLPTSDGKSLAILSSYLKINGSLRVSKDSSYLFVKTENAKTAKFIYLLLNKYFDSCAEIENRLTNNLQKNTIYTIKITKNLDTLLAKLKIDFLSNQIDDEFNINDDKFFGYVCGAFLACGSCNSPLSSNYHLELSFENGEYAIAMQSLINNHKKYDFNMRIIKRKNKFVLYLKKSDLISYFLVLIGACESCVEFENIRVDRDFSNSENRMLNLDGANMGKTIASAEKEIQQIQALNKGVGIDSIDDQKVIIFCKVRLENKEASLKEIAQLMSAELGKNVSKGQVYHITRKLEDLANKYGQK